MRVCTRSEGRALLGPERDYQGNSLGPRFHLGSSEVLHPVRPSCKAETPTDPKRPAGAHTLRSAGAVADMGGHIVLTKMLGRQLGIEQ
jgi:hypothetical protein